MATKCSPFSEAWSLLQCSNTIASQQCVYNCFRFQYCFEFLTGIPEFKLATVAHLAQLYQHRKLANRTWIDSQSFLLMTRFCRGHNRTQYREWGPSLSPANPSLHHFALCLQDYLKDEYFKHYLSCTGCSYFDIALQCQIY